MSELPDNMCRGCLRRICVCPCTCETCTPWSIADDPDDPNWAVVTIKANGRRVRVPREPLLSAAADRENRAGPEDIDHAIATGQKNPSDSRCGCDCAKAER